MELSNLNQFEKDIEEISRQVSQIAEVIVQHIVRMTFTYVTRNVFQSGGDYGSPVWSGQFYNNHRIGIGAADKSVDLFATLDPLNPAPPLNVDSFNSIISKIKVGVPVFISNSLDYASKLEEGWSYKTPDGIYKVAVNAVEQVIPYENWKSVFQKSGYNLSKSKVFI